MIDRAALAADVFASLAEPGTYTPPAGVSVDVSVILQQNVELAGLADYAVIERRAVASLLKSEVSLPARDAALVVGGVSYVVDRVLDDDGHVVKVVVR